MVFDFILETAMFVSLGVAVYFFARGVARAAETAGGARMNGVFDRVLSRLPLKAVDERLNAFSQKLLRRLRLFILRIDNVINNSLNRLKRQNGGQGGNAAGNPPQGEEKRSVFPPQRDSVPLDGNGAKQEQ